MLQQAFMPIKWLILQEFRHCSILIFTTCDSKPMLLLKFESNEIQSRLLISLNSLVSLRVKGRKGRLTTMRGISSGRLIMRYTHHRGRLELISVVLQKVKCSSANNAVLLKQTFLSLTHTEKKRKKKKRIPPKHFHCKSALNELE